MLLHNVAARIFWLKPVLVSADNSPVPVLHLQGLLKGMKQNFRVTMDLLLSRQSSGAGQTNAEAGRQGSTATVLFTLAAHSLGYNLANTEEFEDSPDATASALQDACGALLLPISHWASLASRAASGMRPPPNSATEPEHGSSAADDKNHSPEPAAKSKESPPDAEPATDAAVAAAETFSAVALPNSNSAEEGQGRQPGGYLLESEAAGFEQAWEALLGSVLTVASRKRSFKKEYCGDIARRITSLADRLPVNGMALACLQLASSAAHVLTQEVDFITACFSLFSRNMNLDTFATWMCGIPVCAEGVWACRCRSQRLGSSSWRPHSFGESGLTC